MKEDKKSYNYLALRGSNVDDMEYVDHYGLDSKIAYTPGINDAVLDKVHQQNYDMYIKMGKSEVEAGKMADENRTLARANIKQLLKDINK